MTLDEMFGRMSPEEINQMLGLGNAPKRDAMLEQQLQEQIAAGQPQAGDHTTGLGAALGGLGDVVRGTASAAHVQALRKQQTANLAGDTKTRALALQTAGRSVMDPNELFEPGEAPPLSAPPMVDAGGPMSAPPMVQAPGDTAATINALRHGSAASAVQGAGAPVQGVPQQGPTPAMDPLAQALQGASTKRPQYLEAPAMRTTPTLFGM